MNHRKVHFNVFAAETFISRIEGVIDRAKIRLRIQNYASEDELAALKTMAHLVQRLVPIEEQQPNDAQGTQTEA